MPRRDRTLVEDLFTRKLAQVLVCTATLAWGVNLPARAVIIKGTQIYDAEKSAFVDIGILDVLQIFGRAGRPQYDNIGEGMIITTHDKLSHYLSLLTRQKPIESQFIDKLADNLNAELVLGTVTTVEEAVQWLKYTYLYVRMQKSPLTYGMKLPLQSGPGEKSAKLDAFCHELITAAASSLDKIKMIRFTEKTGFIYPTDLGRTASHYYIKFDTIEIIGETMLPHLDDMSLFGLVSKAKEFEQVKVRDEEMPELKMLESECWLPVLGGPGNPHGKVNILLQAHISRKRVETFSLISDLHYISQNGGRILRGLFDIALKKGWPRVTMTLLVLAKCVDWQLWPSDHPLCQMQSMLSQDLFEKLRTREDLSLERLEEMGEQEIGRMIHYQRGGAVVKKCARQFPCLKLKSVVQPITRTVLRVRVTILPNFEWNERIHGNSLSWWFWVTDSENDHMYYSEFVSINKKQIRTEEDIELVFTIPIFEPIPAQYLLYAVSDIWLHCETIETLSFKHLVLPEIYPPHSELLDLQPLKKTALKNEDYESIFTFSYFNPIQTQVFHSVYHSDQNILLGAPTGSGKTVIAELAMFRVFNHYPGAKCVYVAPLKALVRERMKDWTIRLGNNLRKRVIELTGDVTPDIHAIQSADVIVTTPEKWDGISRSWQTRSYVRSVMLLIIDEIHLLGEDRGPVLEVIVSRTNFISSQTESKLRIIGLSTALANARDLAEWLGIKAGGLFNFKPSVRPVPLEVHIEGFPGKHYCPRMATMNKPAFKSILTHSPHKPVLIFVSSRRQTRLTALDLIGFLALEGPKQWLKMVEDENLDSLLREVQDPNLSHFLSFGIGVHHAGLHENDRKIAEQLFVDQRIQILIATSTLAWGVNFPAHLVIVKGTEYYDGKLKRYIDFPITDVLQMMGRAGRPQFDNEGVAVILVHNIKKDFYKKFLYEPFPVESSLLEVIPDHLNAEIVSGSIKTRQDCIDYLTWTYLFRRIFLNPSYYHMEGVDEKNVNTFLSSIIGDALRKLEAASCIFVEDTGEIRSLQYGRVASFYYLKHGTMRLFKNRLSVECSLIELIKVMCNAEEYAELPVRHNEDILNKELASCLPVLVADNFDSPHTKTFLLYQSHFSRSHLPIADYVTDRKSVLDQSFRILNAMLDIVAAESLLEQTLSTIHIIQMVSQACWVSEPSLLMLPHVTMQSLEYFKFANPPTQQLVVIESISELICAMSRSPEVLEEMLREHFTIQQILAMTQFVKRLPSLRVEFSLKVQLIDDTVKPVQSSITPDRITLFHLIPGKEHIVEVRLQQTEKRAGIKGSRADTPRFPKPKDEGWWIILGESSAGSLISMKRVTGVKRVSNISLAFTSPTKPALHELRLFLMSDSYIGLDQRFNIHVEVMKEC
ncbi:hypothetical protein LOD99_142 [Oopsacas minuta]|uniref:Activating signal cointegrator 1 complex subunit 3 n=1 Tax=Oopsacas minuta TaxID=111878 RepID=A0AAV7KBD5_9METZ|nr:hypothetical protein LOD99_142 [Oopsacas minuta]